MNHYDATDSADSAGRPLISPCGAELSVIVPTFNEADNVGPLIEALDVALAGLRWEVIFVDDDSPDGTAAVVREKAWGDSRIRCLHRIGRRGLSTACIEGFLASSAPILAVFDGDMQHDEAALPEMLRIMRTHADVDIVVGTRYSNGGGIGDWDATRASISRFATWLSRLVLKADLSDPMSGFFMVRRRVVQAEAKFLSGIGFKILLDLFASAQIPLVWKELPYTFRSRVRGESKLDSQAAWDYAMLLLDKKIGRFLPARFLSFALVGTFGVLVDLSTFGVLTKLFAFSFVAGRIGAVASAMTANFLVNNALTYRDRRLKGLRLLRGWVSFSLACSLGALSNVGISNYLHSNNVSEIVSIIGGIAVGVVWNYAVTSIYTWGEARA